MIRKSMTTPAQLEDDKIQKEKQKQKDFPNTSLETKIRAMAYYFDRQNESYIKYLVLHSVK